MDNEKDYIRDYAEDLQQLCGNFKRCTRCIKRGKNIATHYCFTKRYAFALAKIYVSSKVQLQKQEMESKQ
ncbi:MAG: hypothetical protein QXY78_03925 [Thermoplasmata archaeon]